MKKTIAVIGSGISGLSIALRLSQKGFKVIILEKQKIAGGISTSISYKQSQMDMGPHVLILPKSGTIYDEIIGKTDLLEISWPYAQSYTSNGFFHKSYPLFYDILLNCGLKYFLKGTFGICKNSIKNYFNKPKFHNAEEYFIGMYGNFLYYNWFKPYFSKSCRDLKLESIQFAENIFHPITPLRIFNFIKKRINSFQNQHNPSKEYFTCYPKNGMGSFIQKIIDDIKYMNGEIVFDANVESIIHNENFKSISYTKDNKEYEIKADGIVYSTPVPITLKWFSKIPIEIKNEIQKNTFFNSIMVFLLIDKPMLIDRWIVTMYDLKSIIFRISQQNYLSEDICPKNTTLLCIEMQTTKDDSFETLENSKILELVKKELERIKILNEEKILESKIIRLPNIYPITSLDNVDLDRVMEFITSFKNEYLINTKIDTGKLVATQQSTDDVDPKATGVYKALLNADSLTKRIMNEIKLE